MKQHFSHFNTQVHLLFLFLFMSLTEKQRCGVCLDNCGKPLTKCDRCLILVCEACKEQLPRIGGEIQCLGAFCRQNMLKTAAATTITKKWKISDLFRSNLFNRAPDLPDLPDEHNVAVDRCPLSGQALRKACPGCGVAVERISGTCSTIHCPVRSCKVDWCWQCGFFTESHVYKPCIDDDLRLHRVTRHCPSTMRQWLHRATKLNDAYDLNTFLMDCAYVVGGGLLCGLFTFLYSFA